jgi:L-asparaginase
VQIITTGGTIASRIDATTGAVVPVIGAEELVASVPGLGDIADLRVTEFSKLDSSNMTPTLHAALARAVESTLADSTVRALLSRTARTPWRRPRSPSTSCSAYQRRSC